ncbi:class I alpha-mannosidase 1A [Histoplasma capsulatum G186AR]|uniref:alpha-1,2-Mannosidase n=2 Tax=Ajellomyces capsulatus TaxID=5037 RepID=C0NH28_AJECG|nr:class I alpha-mannosidase 1A [Histoplasma capsulatum G186AR]EEH09113.1 class I alpha-mannosidase 1A [Histoplasma capsulatum G186AR]KAG5303566.1 class I alpha-mannosidase 1A [Histoplasma capsulatum]QSS69163.1 class I alpha-mannosidase 1A [Histoplasma capsulatum G186AR]
MPRFRRYRVFVVFAVISVVSFVHFSRILYGSTPSTFSNESTRIQKQKPLPPPLPAPPRPIAEPPRSTPLAGNLEDHGFAPESTTAVPTSNPTPAATQVANPPPGQSPVPHSPQQESTKSDPQTEPISPLHEEDELQSPGQGRVEVDGFNKTKIRWEKQPEHYPVPPENLIRLPKGAPKTLPKIQFEFPEESPAAKADREAKLAVIKASFNHSWTGYKAEAWGHDELRPVSGGYRDPFSGWGATLVDALDTLWIMGMEAEFEEAVEAVKKIDFATSPRRDIPLFETVIRYLGGLIGAYDISGGKYQILLDKAVELAEILMGAFDTPNRMPVTYYLWRPRMASRKKRANSRTVTAEIGSLAVEFTRLAQITEEAKYYDAVARITNELEKFQEKTKIPGIWPTHLDASGCKRVELPVDQTTDMPTRASPPIIPENRLPERQIQKRDEIDPLLVDAEPANYDVNPDSQLLPPSPVKASSDDDRLAESTHIVEYGCEDQGFTSPPRSRSDRFTIGGLVDSVYEYLPKQYALLGGLNDQYQAMHERAMNAVKKYLLFRPMLPDARDVLFIASATTSEPVTEKGDLKHAYEGTHLACFAGGLFAIGAKLFGIEDDLAIATKLTNGCVWAYGSTTTGIMPEVFEMLPCESLEPCEWNKTRYYDALDPYFAERKSYHDQTVAEHERQLPDPVQPWHSDANSTPVPTMRQSAPSQAAITPTVSLASTASPSPLNEGDIPDFLSHEEFAQLTIQEERLPPGMSTIPAARYILRPEAIESVFIMYRITGDDSWRQKGWKMFQAIEAATRTELANSAIKDVTSRVPIPLNEMESFWLAETLKYTYLLFSDPKLVSLDEYILNTEAHPLKRPLH